TACFCSQTFCWPAEQSTSCRDRKQLERKLSFIIARALCVAGVHKWPTSDWIFVAPALFSTDARVAENSHAARTQTSALSAKASVNCRKCRLEEMERMLSTKFMEDKRATTPTAVDQPDQTWLLSPSSTPSDHPSCKCDNEDRKPRELLQKIRQNYRSMCETRIAGELCMRKDPPSALAIVDKEYVGIISNRILIFEERNSNDQSIWKLGKYYGYFWRRGIWIRIIPHFTTSFWKCLFP
ncbi:hypothetical protein PENTCL1PPCAC_12853, partial [Pristionchus entomophagus]